MILQFSIPQDFLQIDGVVCAADGADDGYPLKKFQVQQFAGHGCGSLVDLDGLTVFHWKRGFFDELVNLPVSFYEAASVGQRGFDDLQDEVFFFGRIVGISPIESNFVDAFQQNAYKDGDVGQSYTQSAQAYAFDSGQQQIFCADSIGLPSKIRLKALEKAASRVLWSC